MDAHECAFVLTRQRHARGAVRLVADNQIELPYPVLLLGLGNDIDRLVGGEDHCAARIAFGPRGHHLTQALGVGRGREGQIVDRDVFAVLAHLGIRTHGKRPDLIGGLRRPLLQRLGQQRNGGHQEQHQAVGRRFLLHDLERGEGLTRAAGHDQLAALVGLEAFGHGLQRRLLVLEGLLLGAQHHLVRLGQGELGPIHGAVFQVRHPQAGARDLLGLQRVFGVLAPLVGGGHDEP